MIRGKVSAPVVLVVDDHSVVRAAVGGYLSRHGFAAMVAEDGEAALALLEERHVDLVLLDLRLPRLDGLEVLERVRQQKPALQLPVMILSTSDQAPDIVSALDRGANDYVVKPPDLQVLLARIRNQLALCQTQDEPDRLGPYRLLRRLGGGSSGGVYEAIDTRLERRVALKILNAEEDGSKRGRFLNEARSIGKLRHPNIVRIYDVGTWPRHHLVMELVDGMCLKRRIQEHGPLSFEECLHLSRQLCSALQAVHQAGMLHRDLSCSNVLVDGEGHLCLLDFGLAKWLDQGGTTRTGEILGTPCYMAPEQIDPERGPLGPHTDVFAVGGLLFEMLTGRPPFYGPHLAAVMYGILHEDPPDIRSLRPSCPRRMESMILRALAKDPSHRYRDARALAGDLEKVLVPCRRTA